jgi:hypothetical protein
MNSRRKLTVLTFACLAASACDSYSGGNSGGDSGGNSGGDSGGDSGGGGVEAGSGLRSGDGYSSRRRSPNCLLRWGPTAC